MIYTYYINHNDLRSEKIIQIYRLILRCKRLNKIVLILFGSKILIE